MARKQGPSLSVGRGEKLPVSKGGGLTAKGRAKYNKATGSKLKAPQKSGPRHKSFCARSKGWTGERGRAARRRWGCRWKHQKQNVVFTTISTKDVKRGYQPRNLVSLVTLPEKPLNRLPGLPSVKVLVRVHLQTNTSQNGLIAPTVLPIPSDQPL